MDDIDQRAICWRDIWAFSIGVGIVAVVVLIRLAWRTWA